MAKRAFYDALARNENAAKLMSNEALRVIAIELGADKRLEDSKIVSRWPSTPGSSSLDVIQSCSKLV